MRHFAKLSCRSVKPLPRYGYFSTFQDGGRPRTGFFLNSTFQLPIRFGGSMCVKDSKKKNYTVDGSNNYTEKTPQDRLTYFIRTILTENSHRTQ